MMTNSYIQVSPIQHQIRPYNANPQVRPMMHKNKDMNTLQNTNNYPMNSNYVQVIPSNDNKKNKNRFGKPYNPNMSNQNKGHLNMSPSLKTSSSNLNTSNSNNQSLK